ncbi:hypothetical protein ACIA8R_24605 [Nonomuraea sp. NPDC051191]|uniref:hypothetical protein n=1 Tax=Nonomuraea sp. NPDC051191 TaxID=3364372 RepID=UPI0037A73F7B
MPTSTVSDLLNGRSQKVPDFMLMRTIVEVCQVIAVKSGMPIETPEELTREFSALWQMAKEGEGESVRRGDRPPAADRTGGDVLEPVPGEQSSWRPSPTELRVPLHWGRLGMFRLRSAERGDARAAHELAVLLACEACGAGGKEAEHWRRLATYWNHRALGAVPEAAGFQLRGRRLAAMARTLAEECAEAGKPSSTYFWKAVRQAEASVPAVEVRAVEMLREAEVPAGAVEAEVG